MAVPARPASGAPVASDWGSVVHDTAVAQDIQTGQVNITLTNQSSQSSPQITFVRPFAAIPMVTCSISGSPAASNKLVPRVQTISPTGMTLSAWQGDATQTSVTVTLFWIAIGPRA